MRKFITALVFAGIATPALAEKTSLTKAELPECEIWASTEAPNIPALIAHEMARCWGWTYTVTARPKPGQTNFRARIRPLKYRLLGAYPNAVIHWVTEKDAYAQCGSWGCAYGGVD